MKSFPVSTYTNGTNGTSTAMAQVSFGISPKSRRIREVDPDQHHGDRMQDAQEDFYELFHDLMDFAFTGLEGCLHSKDLDPVVRLPGFADLAQSV